MNNKVNTNFRDVRTTITLASNPIIMYLKDIRIRIDPIHYEITELEIERKTFCV